MRFSLIFTFVEVGCVSRDDGSIFAYGGMPLILTSEIEVDKLSNLKSAITESLKEVEKSISKPDRDSNRYRLTSVSHTKL